MKVRLGFVANSSSVSFCIYGICTDKDEIVEAINKLRQDDGQPEEPEDDFYEELEALCSKIGLYSNWYYDGDCVYIGREWATVEDNETGGHFKKKTEQLISQIIPNPQCRTYEEAWSDG